MTQTLTATIWREDDGYVALCSELDIASQGDSVEEARRNLKEAVELFFETASPGEIRMSPGQSSRHSTILFEG
jgi:predicted RNase H-like HicB family nuclease